MFRRYQNISIIQNNRVSRNSQRPVQFIDRVETIDLMSIRFSFLSILPRPLVSRSSTAPQSTDVLFTDAFQCLTTRYRDSCQLARAITRDSGIVGRASLKVGAFDERADVLRRRAHSSFLRRPNFQQGGGVRTEIVPKKTDTGWNKKVTFCHSNGDEEP